MTGPYEREVQYYETDRMGIVHHSNYIRWYEEARGWYLDQLKIPYSEIEKMGILIPVLEVQSTFRKSFTYGDIFQIYLKITRFNGVKMDLEYEVYNKETHELCNTGSSSHCFLNREMKPFVMKREFLELYQILKDAEGV